MIQNLTECYKLHTIIGKVYGEKDRDALLNDDWSDTDVLRAAATLVKRYELNTHKGFHSVPAFKEEYAQDLVRFYNDLSRLTGSTERLEWTTNCYGGQMHLELFFTGFGVCCH